MNRTSKWYQTTKENRRPSRKQYLLLRLDEDSEPTSTAFDDIDHSYKLSCVKPDYFLEKVLEPGDTLLTLSLQFNCPVAELKRINHILRDNEIYARRKIKVPVKPGSWITERLAGVHVSNSVKGEGYNDGANATSIVEEDEISTVKETDGHVSKQYSCSLLQLHEYNKFEENENVKYKLNRSASPVFDGNTLLDLKGSCEHSASVPDNEVEKVDNIPFKCNGADWGLSWIQLLICVLLFGFAGPLFYILYITEKKHKN